MMLRVSLWSLRKLPCLSATVFEPQRHRERVAAFGRNQMGRQNLTAVLQPQDLSLDTLGKVAA
jgi:hypothetical protein